MNQKRKKNLRRYRFSWGAFLFGLTVAWCWLPGVSLGEKYVELPLAAKVFSLDESAEVSTSDSDLALRNRLIAVAILVGVLVAMIGVIYGYLKLELVTRGFYSGRLQVAAAVASLVVAATAYFLWLALKSNLVGVS